MAIPAVTALFPTAPAPTAPLQPVARAGDAAPVRHPATSRGADIAAFCAGATLPVLWALAHSYGGIEGDARIYMGRVLADLDPAGVGRDIMFAFDGQSNFSAFRPLASLLARTLGFGPMVMVLTIASLASWFVAIVVFARTLAPGRGLLVVLAVVCVVPRLYSPWNLLAAGEAMPIPRPFAEAGVLLALAALCHGRVLLAAAALVVAAAFHPIMAAPGFAVLLLVLGWRDRRWLAAAAAGTAAVVAAALAGVPGLARLATTVDPEWLHLLLVRNPYLFLHLWPHGDWAPPLVRLSTIALALRLVPPPTRLVLAASMVAAVGGVAIALVLGDGAANLLVLQAQLWRALWLPAALGPVAAGLCLLHLPGRGAAGQIATALLAFAWIATDTVPLAPLAAAAAVATMAIGPRVEKLIGRPTVIAVALGCAVLAAISVARGAATLSIIMARTPADLPTNWQKAWPLAVPVVPVVLAAVMAWRWPRHRLTVALSPLVLVAGLAVLATQWDTLTPAHADADAATVKPDLMARLATRPGPVLWLDGDDSWYWARRANWASPTQGGGIVFSRPLALLWQDRARALIAAGLASPWMLEPASGAPDAATPPLDAGRIATLCRRPDAPASIMMALDPGQVVPAALNASLWQPPVAHWKMIVGTDDVTWRHLERYAVIPCATGPASP